MEEQKELQNEIENSTSSANDVAIEFKNVCKTFGTIKANQNITFSVKKGEIMALLGENGSGKTTLMNMLAGIYFPDSGQIFVDGKEVSIRSPKDSFDLKIGMIHQHFKLVDVFTATENIALGQDNEKYNLKATKAKIKEICDKYGFEVNPDARVYDMSVSEKQTLEIVKVLYRGAEILILDEPTAVLTPQETDKLFAILKNMKEDGKSIIIITHKLHEVLAISDKDAILRKGEYITTINTKEATELSLTEAMVGQKVTLDIKRTEPVNLQTRIEVRNLSCLNKYGIKALDNVSFDIRSGEILGIAGIAGSGQKELLESIAGLQVTEAGSSILYHDPDNGQTHEFTKKTPRQIKRLGVSLAFVPEDRLGMGLVGSMGMVDNMMLRTYEMGASPFLNSKKPKQTAANVKEEFGVLTPSLGTPLRRLSGGNIQKVLVGREIAGSPKVLMMAYAVRGLDINTSYVIYNILSEEKEKGNAVVYVGEDLDVLLDLCDRILVLCGGKVSGIVDARTTTKQEVGALMTKISNKGEQNG